MLILQKLLQINGWTGRIKDGLSRFIASGQYDAVCIQEAIWSDNCNEFLELYVDTIDKITRVAKFDHIFKSSNYGTKVLDGGAQFEIGNAILSNNSFIDTREDRVLGEYMVAENIEDCKNVTTNHCYKVQKVVLDSGLAIINYHGYWQKDPLGNKTSIECMRKVANFVRNDYRPTIMCGDLNVVSESPAMRELDFMQDLTAANQVETTLRNVRFVKDVACDHILITNEINCRNFEVIDAPISDHKALVIEFEL